MAVERLRVFKGVTELNYATLGISKTNDQLVDGGNVEIQADSNVDRGSVLDFKKADGSTTVFSAQVIEKKREIFWNLRILTNGYELNNLPVEQVYENFSPEDIVKDVVDSFTSNLTFASTATSGVTIEKYVAQGYAIDIIKDMLDILRWQFRIDFNNNVYCEPYGNINNGVVFTNGSNFQTESVNDDGIPLVNHVKVKGGFQSFNLIETISGTGSSFVLSKKPQGSMRVLDLSNAEVDPSGYVVDSSSPVVDFTTPLTDPTFQYSYDRPVVVEYQDDVSIAANGEVFREIPAPWLNSQADARSYAKGIVNEWKDGAVRVTGFERKLNFDTEVGETVQFVDDIRGLNESLVITKITYDGAQGITNYELGPREFLLFDWSREIEQRIKKIERSLSNEDEIVFARNTATKVQINYTVTPVDSIASPQDTFWVDHPTLGRVRDVYNGSVLNFVSDCSTPGDSGRHFGWEGVTTPEETYELHGYRLTCADFNGSTHYLAPVTPIDISISDINFMIKPTLWGTDLIKLSSSADISIDGSGNITTNGLSNVSVSIDNASGTQLSTPAVWENVNIIFDLANANDVEIGRETTYYKGLLDELFFFESSLTTPVIEDIINKNYYDVNNGFEITTPILHLAFDNPKVGLNLSTPVVI